MYTLFWIAVVAVGGLAANTNLPRNNGSSPTTNNTTPALIPNRYIVEFADDINPQQAASELAGLGVTVLKVFASDVFNGASIESSTHNIDTLQMLKPVAQSWHSKKLKLQAPVGSRQTFDATAAAANISVHGMTGVDELHKAGILGKGAQVAVVDTGVWYRHPALGGGFGPGFKVAGGYDLVGEDWAYNTSVKSPGPDPLDGQGHGTHVSGIIAGQGSSYVGVAPEASLYVYKVFGAYADYTDTDTLLEAFLMAYNDGADVITCSVGGLSGFSDDPWAVAASRLVEQGVVVTIANGNDGASGPFTESNGSNGEFVLAVASVNSDVQAASTFEVTFEKEDGANTTTVSYQASVFWDSSPYEGWPIVPFNPDPTAPTDACHAFNSGQNTNYTGSIVLASDGDCDWTVKQSVLSFGTGIVVPILIYTSGYPISPYFNGTGDNTVAYIPAEAGEAILQALRDGNNVTANFPSAGNGLTSFPNTWDGGVPSWFSSIGPTNDLNIKPDVAAPGGDIFSTWLDDGWAILSGTSMATPYIAGVAALYIGKHGGRSVHGPGFAKDLAMRIIGSGKSLPWIGGPFDNTQNSNYGFHAPVFQVGTGLVNASKVLGYQTSLSFTKFALNDTHHFERYQSINITNNSPNPVTYTFSLEAGGSVDTFVINPDSTQTPLIGTFTEVFTAPFAAVPSVSFPKDTFTVQPGQTKTANINFMYPSNMNADTLPLYGGKVVIAGSNGESLAVPYMGVGGDLHQDLTSVFYYGNGFPYLAVGYRPVPIAQRPSWTFNVNPFARDYPAAELAFSFPTNEFRWDVFDSTWDERDWTYPPVVGKNGFVGAAALCVDGIPLLIPNVSDVSATPFYDQPWGAGGNAVWWYWFGGLANGTQMPVGEYKMRISALRPFSTNPQSSDNWDIIPTPQFTVLPNPADTGA